MTNDDITRLKEAAEKATAGPWRPLRNQGSRWTSYRETANVIGPKDDEGYSQKVCLVNGGNLDDATFIALANPTAILSLLQRLREAEEALKTIDRHNDHPGHFNIDIERVICAHMEKHHG